MTITRHLTSGEIALAQSVYGNTINYSIVLVSNGALVPFQADYTAVTPNGNIYFNQSYMTDFSNPALSLSDRAFFIHEMGHVYQHSSGINVLLEARSNKRSNLSD